MSDGHAAGWWVSNLDHLQKGGPMVQPDAYRRMLQFEKIGGFLEEADHVSKLAVTFGRASLGLAVFVTAKKEQRRQKREEREQETPMVDFDEALIADLIRRTKSAQENIEEAEVVEES